MTKEIHEQPQAVADTLLGRAPPDGTIGARRARDHRRRARATIDKVVLVACGSSYHAALVGQVRDRALGAARHRDRHRQRVPLPRPGARRRDAGRRGQPVGRDHRHPPGPARGPRSGAPRSSRSATSSTRRWRGRPTGSSTPTPGPRSAWPRPRPHLAQIVALELLALHLAQLRGTLLAGRRPPPLRRAWPRCPS